MPMFKKHTKETNAPTETLNSSGATRAAPPTTGTGIGTGTGVGTGAETGIHGGNFTHGANQPVAGDYTSSGYGGADYLPSNVTSTGYGTGQAGAPGAHGYESGWNEPSTVAGGTGTQQTTVPPVGALNDEYHTRGGTRHRMEGKLESALGSALGSETLKARGLQKEQEANALKLQGQELAQAERLEREAAMRRDRAVAHGAHPAHNSHRPLP